MLIVAPQTIKNAGVLETRSLPKKFFGRVQLVPKGAGIGMWARLILEIQFLRYMVALVPFIAIPFMSNDLALPVTQAPLAMVLVIAVVEMRVLRLTDRARQRLLTEDEAARPPRHLHLPRTAALRRIAARRGIAEGEVMLVAEQSELARVPPLTLVSVQSAVPQPHVLDLDAGGSGDPGGHALRRGFDRTDAPRREHARGSADPRGADRGAQRLGPCPAGRGPEGPGSDPGGGVRWR
jgi:hypothetical protein